MKSATAAAEPIVQELWGKPEEEPDGRHYAITYDDGVPFVEDEHEEPPFAACPRTQPLLKIIRT